MTDPVPFNDLKAQYKTIKQEIDSAIQDVLANQAFVMGPAMAGFEEAFAAYCCTEHVVACSSGTTAIHLALLGAGVGPQDEVITTPSSFIGTTEPIMHCGAKVVFADVDPVSLCLDPEKAAEKITDTTRAIIAVNLYGRPADYEGLKRIIGDRPIALIEDSAQAHGAERGGIRSGSLAEAACFSFYPGKNLGAYGDGGAVVTPDAALADRMRLLVNHGRKSKYEHLVEGYNYRMDALQARILSVKLKHLDAWTDARIRIAAQYVEGLQDTGLNLPAVEEGVRHVYHLFVVQTPKRDALLDLLKKKGIQCGLHYPLALHLQPAYKHLGHAQGDFPVSEALSANCLSLPIYAEMTDAQVQSVIQNVQAAVLETGGWCGGIK